MIVVTGTGWLLVEDALQNFKLDTVRVGRNILDTFHNIGGLVRSILFFFSLETV